MSAAPVPSLADRVASGARLLDSARPGWAGRIDASKLDIWSMDLDVLGQLYGTYAKGVIALWGAHEYLLRPHGEASPSWRHGFIPGPDDSSAGVEDAWLREIGARLGAGKAVVS